jgi:hypothetical protein
MRPAVAPTLTAHNSYKNFLAQWQLPRKVVVGQVISVPGV